MGKLRRSLGLLKAEEDSLLELVPPAGAVVQLVELDLLRMRVPISQEEESSRELRKMKY